MSKPKKRESLNTREMNVIWAIWIKKKWVLTVKTHCSCHQHKIVSPFVLRFRKCMTEWIVLKEQRKENNHYQMVVAQV